MVAAMQFDVRSAKSAVRLVSVLLQHEAVVIHVPDDACQIATAVLNTPTQRLYPVVDGGLYARFRILAG